MYPTMLVKEAVANMDLHSQSLNTTDIARTAKVVARKWETPEGKLLFVEVLVVLAAVLLAVLLVFGSTRRRCGNSFIKFAVWIPYTLCYPLVSYTMGQMQSAGFKNELFAVWALCLLIVFGSADNISAYSLEDNEQWKRYQVENMIQFFWVGFLVGTYAHGTKFIVLLSVLYVLSAVKTTERMQAFLSASRSYGLLKNAKVIADHVSHKSSQPDEYDPIRMTGYNYLVIGEEKGEVEINAPDYLMKLKINDKVITVDKIWECTGGLLSPSGDPEGRKKDICLSFGLFKLLRLRFFAYNLAQSHHPKARDFVLRGLLRDGNHERPFRVIEAELGFLYDFFYTKYPIIFFKGFRELITSTLIVAVTLFIAVITFRHYRKRNDDLNLITANGTSVDAYVTFGVIVALVVIQLAQLFVYLFSDWSKVSLLCNYVGNPSWQKYPSLEKALDFVCGPRKRRSWQRKMDQYSLLESFHYNPRNISHRITDGLTDKSRPGQKKGKKIELPDEVKKAIVCALKSSEGKLSNGESALQRHRMSGQLSWACRLETHTHIILVWHIATTLCETAGSRNQGREQEDTRSHRLVATSLSNYCAYLVAFVPGLLPDHSYVTKVIFDQVVLEAREILKNIRSEDKIYEELMKAGNSADNIVTMGAKLGKQLIDGIEDHRLRWDMLAEFWAELMLYLSPSDNTTAHADSLTNGGEFITHLWALLFHAAILERPPAPQSV